ncbi:hypothetical protein BpHYR1_023735 [Brachionus plicatilis]|uniref:Uncharacterized protein n=1 Tax=Brachionus plicatilis TaxID=10195 RepID=A0A3M7QYB5_BRAPC|nr:hypothetical protein BpHYR1_023735 [Brachionus plicatilis]
MSGIRVNIINFFVFVVVNTGTSIDHESIEFQGLILFLFWLLLIVSTILYISQKIIPSFNSMLSGLYLILVAGESLSSFTFKFSSLESISVEIVTIV